MYMYIYRQERNVSGSNEELFVGCYQQVMTNEERKNNKMDIFVMELLDYEKPWKNIEGRFIIGE